MEASAAAGSAAVAVDLAAASEVVVVSEEAVRVAVGNNSAIRTISNRDG